MRDDCMVTIRRYKNKDLETLNNLLYKEYNLKRKGISSKDNIELVAVLDNKVVGYLVLTKIYNVVKAFFYGYITYVCVLEEYRNQNIATNLFKEVFKICEKEDIKELELTSNSTRVAAHHLYNKLGFKIRETDVFRKEFI